MKTSLAIIATILSVMATASIAQETENWTGGYWGATFGLVYAENEHDWSAGPDQKVKVEGAAISAIYGRNYAVNNIVVGIEADVSLSNAHGFSLGVSTPCITPGEACENNLKAAASLRGRFGVPLESGALPFVTLGVLAGKVEATADLGACAGTPCSLDEVRFGWVAGIGVDKAMRSGWNLRAEILYMDLGKSALDNDGANSVIVDFQYSALRAGLTRKF